MSKQRWTVEQVPPQTGRIAVVTGANSGIGFEVARVLAGKGATVLLGCRDEQKGREAIERIRAECPTASLQRLLIDLGDLESVRAAAAVFGHRSTKLDLLINNAGVMMPPYGKTTDGFELQWGTNHLGHFALTGLLLQPLLATPGSRVVVVSSAAHKWGEIDFDDLNWEKRGYKKWASYGQSKLANLMFAYELQRRLERAGRTTSVTAAHPGWTATELQRHAGFIQLASNLFAMPAWQGALPTLYAATAPEARGGEYFGPDGWGEMRGYPAKVTSNSLSHDPHIAARLFDLSESLTNVRYEIKQLP